LDYGPLGSCQLPRPLPPPGTASVTTALAKTDDGYMHLFVLLILALVTPAPLATPTPSAAPSVSLGSVTLGQPASRLITQRGEPYAAQTNGENGLWAYLTPAGSAIELVAIRRGYVTGAAVIQRSVGVQTHEDLTVDGVHLGDAFADLPAYANTGTVTMDGVVYTFIPTKDKSKIFSMGMHLADDRVALLPSLDAMPLLHDGSSLADAVVVRANSDILGTMFENAFIGAHNYCTKPGKIKMMKQSLIHNGSKSYDQMDTGCDNGDKTKSYYFDITDSFGKQ
jgi:hypothetical protein